MNTDPGYIEQLVEPAVSALGCELICVQWARVSGNDTLRVFIDKPTGVTVDDCADVSRQVEAILDVEDTIKGEYFLEISSPGLDRPLTKPDHFRQFCGRSAQIKLYGPMGGRRNITGVIEFSNDKTVVVASGGERLEIGYGDIKSAKLCVEH